MGEKKFNRETNFLINSLKILSIFIFGLVFLIIPSETVLIFE